MLRICTALTNHGFRSRPCSTKRNRTMATSPDSASLAAQSCAGQCSKATKLLTNDIQDLMKNVPFWQLNSAGDAIERKFVARNFMAAVSFFTKVAEVAEAEGHHPDLHLTSYRNVEVVLSTHDIGGLSINDFIVAAKIDAVEVEYSPKWLREFQQQQQQQ